jgi:hypothetical protein
MKWSLWQFSAKAFVRTRSTQQVHKKICFFIFSSSDYFSNPLWLQSLAYRLFSIFNSLINSYNLSSNQNSSELLPAVVLCCCWIGSPEMSLSESVAGTGFETLFKSYFVLHRLSSFRVFLSAVIKACFLARDHFLICRSRFIACSSVAKASL